MWQNICKDYHAQQLAKLCCSLGGIRHKSLHVLSVAALPKALCKCPSFPVAFGMLCYLIVGYGGFYQG